MELRQFINAFHNWRRENPARTQKAGRHCNYLQGKAIADSDNKGSAEQQQRKNSRMSVDALDPFVPVFRTI